jgi:hypothetical protein
MRALFPRLVPRIALLTMLLAAPAGATDERVSLALLPAAGERPLHELAEANLPPGFRAAPLSKSAAALFLEHPDCRAQPRCLNDHLPEGVDLVVDLRLVERDGAAALDLRLLRGGDLYGRRATSLGPSRALSDAALEAALAAELEGLLAGWTREERLYKMAREGDDEAARQLRQRFPESPWTRSLSQPTP